MLGGTVTAAAILLRNSIAGKCSDGVTATVTPSYSQSPLEDCLRLTLRRAVARDIVRNVLIDCRGRARKTATQAADALTVLNPKFKQSDYSLFELENPEKRRRPTEAQLELLLTFFGAEDRFEVMRQILEIAWKRTDDAAHSLGLSPEVEQLFAMELFAESFEAYEVEAISGLLQIKEYAERLIRYTASYSPGLNVDRVLALKLERQKVLDRPNPPMFTMYIREAALRDDFAGQQIQCKQLKHLLLMGKRRNIVIRVVPRGVPPMAKGSGLFIRYTPKWHVALADTMGGASYLDQVSEMETVVRHLAELHRVALDHDGSADLIRTIIEDLEGK